MNSISEISHASKLSPDAEALLGKARDVNSQTGEDGIIEAILLKVGQRDHWCVEFGAWDGRYLSNTRRLIDEENYSAVLIEADVRSFRKLASSFAEDQRVHCMRAFVGYGEKDGLDALLRSTSCPRRFDVLSIDIDGNDIHVWAATTEYRPKLVCIEFNPTIPTPVSFAQPRRPDCKQGASLRALFELGLKKRYKLVCANAWNAFFVAEEYWEGDYARAHDDLTRFRMVEPEPIYLFSGYDGTVLLSQPTKLGWHNVEIGPTDIQALPKILRKFPDDYSWYQRWCFATVQRLQAARHRRRQLRNLSK